MQKNVVTKILTLTPQNRAILERKLVKKCLTFYDTLMLITALKKKGRQWQMTPVHNLTTTPSRPVLVLTSHLCLGNPRCFFLSDFPLKL